MNSIKSKNNLLPSQSRRIFLQGLAAGGVITALGLKPDTAFAATVHSGAPELRGSTFDLVIDERPVNFTGQTRTAKTINGSIPGPTLRWREGDVVTLRVTNRLSEPTSLHWHGIILPFEMDGVPGLSYAGIAPGTTFVYQFRVNQSGTYWYHSHSGFQEQNAVYGAIVIDPAKPDRVDYDRDFVVLLSDWSDSSPDFIFNRLKTGDGYYNYIKPDLVDLYHQAQKQGIDTALKNRLMWDRMRMSPRDLLDVSGSTYTYLMSGSTPTGDWTARFKPGEKVRLRFINGSSMSYFDVRIPGLKMTVVAADGQDVHPVTIDEFRMGVAETLDVIVEPKANQAYCVFAQAMDRSGYARGTLTPHADLRAPLPSMDPVPTLTMADMGMGMDMNGMAHKAMDMGSSKLKPAMAGMDSSKLKPDMAGMDMNTAPMPGMDHGSAANPIGQNPFDLPGLHNRQFKNGMLIIDWTPPTEHGVGVDMIAQQVSLSLRDPGAGLRNNGRKVLTYSDLRGLDGPISKQEPTRGIELHLTGNMNRYIWGFNGVSYANAAPITLNYGETVRVVLINDTMMNHPIHLHGMWSELEDDRGNFLARKHTLSVAPGHAITYRVTANAIGRWAYHCHLLYHMNAGMFREVRVS